MCQKKKTIRIYQIFWLVYFWIRPPENVDFGPWSLIEQLIKLNIAKILPKIVYTKRIETESFTWGYEKIFIECNQNLRKTKRFPATPHICRIYDISS